MKDEPDFLALLDRALAEVKAREDSLSPVELEDRHRAAERNRVAACRLLLSNGDAVDRRFAARTILRPGRRNAA